MKNISIWSDVDSNFNFSSLNEDINVDVLVIGGGMTGISTAYHLSESGLNVCLVEKNKLCCGVTSRTTGKLTYLQENMYSKLLNYHNLENVKLYLDSQIVAMNMVVDIVNKNKIDCNLEKVRSYVFSFDKDGKLEKEINLLKSMGVALNLTNVLPTKDDVMNAYFVEDTYVFHPLKYLYKLVDVCRNRGVCFYEDTKVVSVDKKDDYFVCRTDTNVISAKYVVMAVHYPYFLFPFLMPFKSYLEKSYIEAFKVNYNHKFSAISISKPVISTRFYTEGTDNYQIYLTNSHNCCVKNNDEKNFFELVENNEKEAEYLWSNKDIITSDLLPYIGKINDSNLLIGTGYNTWGMTNGSLAGLILADIILNRNNNYIELFNPNRKFNLGNLVNFPVALWSSAYSFLKNKLKKDKDWYSDNVRFETRNGSNVAIYVDDLKKEHIVYNLCPHMKCSLIFNEIEKTWDCPCHGSRFDIDGHVIEGPSNYNIVYKE